MQFLRWEKQNPGMQLKQRWRYADGQLTSISGETDVTAGVLLKVCLCHTHWSHPPGMGPALETHGDCPLAALSHPSLILPFPRHAFLSSSSITAFCSPNSLSKKRVIKAEAGNRSSLGLVFLSISSVLFLSLLSLCRFANFFIIQESQLFNLSFELALRLCSQDFLFLATHGLDWTLEQTTG